MCKELFNKLCLRYGPNHLGKSGKTSFFLELNINAYIFDYTPAQGNKDSFGNQKNVSQGQRPDMEQRSTQHTIIHTK